MRTTFATILASVLLMLATALVAYAEPDTNASCIGLGSAESAQQQARDDIALFVKSFGGAPGATYSMFAKEHDGSVLACFGPEMAPPPHP
jgi:hypothetical protein